MPMGAPPDQPVHDRDRSGWFLAGYGGIAGFFAVEALARERGRASNLTADSNDKDSTRLIVVACFLAAVLSPLLRRLPGRLPRAAAPAGLAMQAAGLGLRTWSMRSLGESYSRTLRTEGDQQVVDQGPYRIVRHPGYLGSLLTWTGFALTSRSLPVVATVTGLVGFAYRHRIEAEEALLRHDLPGYAEYTRRTRRLIPGIW
jgi:protein-S-isoprenylcysteine O-methyltransferase Ste14